MLKVQYQKLRLSSKGNLKRIICNGIPVLSIFALLGIAGYILLQSIDNAAVVYAVPNCEVGDIMDPTTGTCISPSNPVCPSGYAWDSTNQKCIEAPETTASLTIGGSTSNETISAGRGEAVYRTHTISIAGSNVKNYVLSIYGDSKLSYVENSSTGQLSTTEYLSSANNTKGSGLPTNTWGYAYSNSTSTSNADLTYTAPTTSAITLASGTIPTGSNGVLSITNNKLVFAAKFDEDKPSGNYKANVNLALTITPRVLTTYSITYDCSNGTGCPINYTENSYEESKTYTIPTTTPTRSGYKFLGYSTSSSATTADANYAPGKAISLTQAAPNVKLYAVWQNIDFNNISTMQEMTSEICSAASVGSTRYLQDLRDGKYYWVAKLKDNNCWMVQNLDLNLNNVTLDSSNTDTNTTWKPNLTSTKWSGSAASNLTVALFHDAGLYVTTKPTTRITANTSITNTSYWTNVASMTASTDANFGATIVNNTYNAHYLIGNSYSWAAATANSGNGLSSGEAAYSICPKGWRLPSRSMYTTLVSGLNITSGATGDIRVAPYYFLYSGNIYVSSGTTVDAAGSEGIFWTSTATNTNSAYNLYLTDSINASDYSTKGAGRSIRCVAR